MKGKAENCQFLEGLKELLSCEQGADCDPEENIAGPSLIISFFELASTAMCSFQCTVGEERCDETLNPDKTILYHFPFSFPTTIGEDFQFSSKKSYSRTRYYSDSCGEEEMKFVENRYYTERVDENLHLHVTSIDVYEDDENGLCEKQEDYVLICERLDRNDCKRIDKYTDEWYAYERELQLKKYRESCYTATEETCANIAKERAQCQLDVVDMLNKSMCHSGDPIWMYRRSKERIEEPQEYKENNPTTHNNTRRKRG